MFGPILLATLVASSLNTPPPPVNLAAIDRVILMEPTYVGKPRYALLVFGKDARTRIWIVRDDKSLYVDHNGNGDLTEPSERMDNQYGSFNIDQLVERNGTVHRDVYFHVASNDKFRIRLGQHRQGRTQYVGWGRMEMPTFGDRPDNAPIIHFDGPLTLANYGPTYTMPRGDGTNRSHKLRLLLGTPGIGAGTFASFSDVCSKQLGNLHADIEYPLAAESGKTFRQRVELVHDG
ncbi:MAG: hypothetical protein EXS16_18195 [Gemmataceae bacterium]|nr:hypothetical protein [Gemmataceae bacterium]